MNDLRLNDLFDLLPNEGGLRQWLRAPRELPDSAPPIRLDVSEADDAYMVKATIPGVRKEDIDVRVDGNQVTISAEVKKDSEEKEGSRVLRSECHYGFASRSFSLASAVDEARAEAKYSNGVLQLRLPKRATAATKRVAVS